MYLFICGRFSVGRQQWLQVIIAQYAPAIHALTSAASDSSLGHSQIHLYIYIYICALYQCAIHRYILCAYKTEDDHVSAVLATSLNLIASHLSSDSMRMWSLRVFRLLWVVRKSVLVRVRVWNFATRNDSQFHYLFIYFVFRDFFPKLFIRSVSLFCFSFTFVVVSLDH